jgi:hypothetical protein
LSSKAAMNLFSVWDSDALEIAHDHFYSSPSIGGSNRKATPKKTKSKKKYARKEIFLQVNQKKSETNKDFRSGFH